MVSYSSLCIYWRWPRPLKRLQLVSVLSAGFLIHLSLGSLYTYGNLVPYIVSYVRERSHPQSLRYTDATFILAAQIAGQGSSMALGGLLEKRFGPRLVSLLGGWFMSLGVLLSYLAIKQSFWLLLITYGFMFGLGMGVSYIGPVACAMRWLPKWKGLAAGIIVSGFGLSALFFDIIQTVVINPYNEEPNWSPYDDYPNEKYFTQSQVLDRVPYVFLVLGLTFAVLQVIGSVFLVNPPPPDDVVVEYQPLNEANNIDIKESIIVDDKTANIKASLLQIFRRPNFYILWFMLFFVEIVSTIISALYKSFGFEIVTSDDHFLSITGSISSIFNCFGRIFWGFIVDLTDYKFAFVFQTTIMIALLSTLYAASVGGKGLFFLWMCGIFFCIGGYFVLFPSTTIQLFGTENVGMNYGLIFTALTSGGIIGSFISHWLVRIIEWYGVFFLLTGFNSFVLILAFIL